MVPSQHAHLGHRLHPPHSGVVSVGWLGMAVIREGGGIVRSEETERYAGNIKKYAGKCRNYAEIMRSVFKTKET